MFNKNIGKKTKIIIKIIKLKNTKKNKNNLNLFEKSITIFIIIIMASYYIPKGIKIKNNLSCSGKPIY